VKRWLVLILLIYLSLCLLAGCNKGTPRPGKAYSDEPEGKQQITISDSIIDTSGVIPFTEDLPGDIKHNRKNLVVSISPDHNSVYIMRPSTVRGICPREHVIKGADPAGMGLFRVDVDSGDSELIAPEIPVVSLARWNADGNILALLGGNHLTLYDAANHQLLMRDELQNERVTHFGWSPDGKKLFTAHPNLPNGSILYIDQKKLVHAYENKEELYYKGRLDEDHYYGTYIAKLTNEELAKKGSLAEPQTVVINKDGQIVKVVGEGRFRDAYQRSVLQVGESLFGLNYIPDINQPEQVVTLTNEYVYDARFISNGGIAYIIKSPDVEENAFLLCIADRNGKSVKQFKITGSSLVLSPDGKSVCTKGVEDEEIDLTTLSFKEPRIDVLDRYVEGRIYAVLRGAVDTYYKHEMIGEADTQAVKKYFLDTHSPEQWAYFDIMTYFREIPRKRNADHYVVTLRLKDLKIRGNRASARLTVGAANSFGTGYGGEWAVELIEQNHRWFVTGLSTFPDSPVREEVKETILKVIKEAQEGKAFRAELKNKDVKIGQIQFWRLSEPHRSPDIESANYCKAYLKVKENGKEIIYKLILEKKDQIHWQVNRLSKNLLSSLF